MMAEGRAGHLQQGGPMPVQSALDDQLRQGIARVRRADLLVGIPSFRNAGTIGHVARTVAQGLTEHFRDARVVLVNADGGSEDGTRERVVAEGAAVPVISGRYVGPPGKGSAFRAIFEAAGGVGAGACAGVGLGLRSVTPGGEGPVLGPGAAPPGRFVSAAFA